MSAIESSARLSARAAGVATVPELLSALLLAAWLGAALFFTLVVARAAFAALPSRALAGVVVGHTLPALFVAGVVTGLVLVGLVLVDGSPARAGSWRIGGGAGIAAACAIAQWVIVARIERLRATLGPSIEALSPNDPGRLEFGRLHALSVGALAIAMLLSVALLVLLGRLLLAAPHD